MSTSGLTVTALWERSLVDCAGETTTLVVRIVAPHRPVSTERAPLDVAFVVDRSGSMSGNKLALAKEGVLRAIDHLDGRDRATLVCFDNFVDLLAPLQTVTSNNRGQLRDSLRQIESRGSTDLAEGWLTGCRQLADTAPGGAAHRLKRAILLTDGLANQGITDAGELSRHAWELRSRGISTTTLGLGEDFDETLLAAMAESGGGNFQFIAEPGDLPAFFQRELGELLAIGAARVRLQLTTPDGMKAWLVSTFRNERAQRVRTIEVGDLPAGDEIVLVFDVEVEPRQAGTSHLATLDVTWLDPVTSIEQQVQFPLPALRSAVSLEVQDCPQDAFVLEQGALQRAARAQQEAMRLDREGRYSESRSQHRLAFDMLEAAPDSLIVAERRGEAKGLADYDATQGYSETERKRASWAAFNRSRRERGEKPKE